MTDSLASDLAYLEGRISVALRCDSGRRLKCKQGYIQRGNACQKIGEKKAGGDLARNIGMGLGAAALVGGAAAIGSNSRSQGEAPAKLELPNPSEPSSQIQVEMLNSSKLVRNGVMLSGATITAYLCAKVAEENGASTAIMSSTYRGLTDKKVEIDKAINSLPIPKNQKEGAKELVGGAKRNLAFRLAKKSGVEILEVDKENNSFTYKTEEGNIHTTGSYGSTILTFNTLDKGAKNGAAIFEMNFTTNESFERGTELDMGTAKRIIKAANQMFEKHASLLPDECIVQCKANKRDGRGSSRQSIYEKKGFTKIGISPYLYIVKTGGKVTPIVKESWKKHVGNLLKEKMSFGVRSNSDSLVILRYDNGRKLKCKEGYVQRGNACQKIGEKKNENNLARNIGAGLGAAALVGGVAAIASSRSKPTGENSLSNPQQQKEFSLPQALPQKKETAVDKAIGMLSSKGARKVAIATGSVGAVVAGVVGISNAKLTKDYAVKDVALIMTYKQSLVLGKVADRVLDRSDINPTLKDKAKGLIGMTKLALARKVQTVKGRDLIDVDKESNSFTYRDKKNGGVYTVASVGPALYTFTTVYKKEASGGSVYEVSFAINESNNREESSSLGASGAKRIIRMTKASFDKHIKAMPDNSILTARAYDKDGAGSKRKGIYEKSGFAPMEGQDPMVLYASKKDGKLGPLSNVYKPTQKPNNGKG